MALQTRLHQHSGNSSRPPVQRSAERPQTRGPPPRRRARDGQPGHVGHARAPVPPAQVDLVVEHRPAAGPHCHTARAPDLPAVGAPHAQQVGELPPRAPDHHRTSLSHGHLPALCPPGHGPAPAGGAAGRVRPAPGRARGAVAWALATECPRVAALLGAVFGVPLGLGSVPTLCQQVSAALAAPYAAAATYVQGPAVAHVDETGWKQAGQRRWWWVAVTALLTLFRRDPHRSAAALQALLGADFAGLVGSDRYSADEVLPLERRQLCWAHLKRDLTALAEREGAVGAWGRHGLAQLQDVFTLWHAFRQGRLDRAGLQAALAPVQCAVRTWLAAGWALDLPAAQQWSRAVWARDPALWALVYVEGVEPTNNAAERALRPAVLWRNGCY